MERCNGFHLYNLGASNPISVSDLVRLLEEALDQKAIVEHRPLQPGDVDRTYADVTLAGQELGYRPTTDFRRGLAAFAEWFRGDA